MSFFEGLRTKMLESLTLQEQSAFIGQAQFAKFPALHDGVMQAAMDGDATHQPMIAQFLNSEALQAQVLAKGGLWRDFQLR